MSNFDTNKIYAKTSSALARERFLLGEAVDHIQIEAATVTGYVVEISHSQSATELMLDLPQFFQNNEREVARIIALKPSLLIRRKFERLAEQWKDETLLYSSATEIASHPAYQKIIGMGSDALPLILEDLSKNGSHWFWALIAITGEDPVPSEFRGQVEKMSSAWIEWGKMQGYV